MRALISNAARGQLRLLWSRLATEAAAVSDAVERIPAAMAAAAVKRDIGGRAALNRIVGRLPVPPPSRAPGRCVWRFLQPIADGPPAIMVRAVLLGAPGKPPLAVEDFALLVTHHALARMHDQSTAKVDFAAAIIEAHNNLCLLPTLAGEQLFVQSNVVLPAAGGVFMMQPRERSDGMPMGVARTWVPADLLRETQEHDAAAWSERLARPAPA